jgi:hypothetical protein
MTSLKTTTEAEWNVLKDSKAPWADFESYYYMQNVPTSWISEFDFDHVKTLLEGRDAIMKGLYLVNHVHFYCMISDFCLKNLNFAH